MISKKIGSLKERAALLRREIYALAIAYRDPCTPWYAKVFAAFVVAYAFSPIDLIPDFIPLIGYLDDLILVPLGITLAIRMIPAEVMADARQKADKQLAAQKNSGWVAAVAIILVWLLVLGLVGLWVYNQLAAH